MMTTEQIAAHLKRISYKPGWELEVYDGRWEGQHLVVHVPVQDSFTGEPTTLEVHSVLPPMRDADGLEEWVAWRLGRIELHETREFLKRDGKVIFNPHGPDADQDRA